MSEEILDRRNLEKAVKAVISNKGSGGVDGMQTDELHDYLIHHFQALREEIPEGNYRPSPELKLIIPKVQGGYADDCSIYVSS